MKRVLAQRRHAVCLAVLAAGLAALAPVVAPSQQPSEQQVKAAFLYHFAQYVEWPRTAFSSHDAPLVVGVLGDGGYLEAIAAAAAGKIVAGHPVAVDPLAAPSEGRGCHVVFITPSRSFALPEVLKAVGSAPVLVAGDSPSFAASGGVIGFVMRDRNVAFEINPAAARRAGLRISSKLLRLAEIVDGA